MPANHTLSPDFNLQDVAFHQVKYRLAAIFAQIADSVHARVLPAHTLALAIDKELRQAEATAPEWLRWKEGHEHLLPADGNLQRMIPQQHMVGLLLHKGLLGERHRHKARRLICSRGSASSPVVYNVLVRRH